MTIDKYLNEKIKQLEKINLELKNVRVLSDKFPDLTVKTNRWNHEHYVSKEVNSIATHVGFCFSCGCCDDSPWYVMPYCIENMEKVYSDPFQICIGEKNWECGILIDSDWEEKLRSYNISDTAIEKVRQYISEHTWDPNEYDNEEEDNDE